MKNLPLGKQTFKDIINDNKLYVDKTKEIYKLLENGDTYFFLSRPRRFGKSLLVTTLEEIFLGNKELFKDLWIYDKIEFKKYPVIRIDFSDMNYSTAELLEKSIDTELKSIARRNHIIIEEGFDFKSRFKELIEKLSEKEKVVILIDEYDSPIINHIDNIKMAQENRKVLKLFYSTLKANDKYIKFAFLTGVSKFSKISVFSDLNNITDITMNDNFSTIVGLTENEVYSYFDDRIKILANKLKVTELEIKEVLKKWYNGYSWDGENFVYNPYSLLNVFNENKIKNYWFQSATPTLLIKLIENYTIDIKKVENCILTEDNFSTYEVDKMNVYALLFQTGYLTIKEIKQGKFGNEKYILSYPNIEVKQSFLTSLLDSFAQNNPSNGISIFELIENLENNKIDDFFNILKTIFGSIPHQIIPKNSAEIDEKEFYYHTIFHLIFTLIGVNVKSEISVSQGRVDSVVETDNFVYIFEFKLKHTPDDAIKQIEEKCYYESYLSSKKEIFLIGVNFDVSKRNIQNCVVKKYKKLQEEIKIIEDSK